MELKRIIWSDYAGAFASTHECVNTKQSQDFAIEFIPYALPFFTGEGDPSAAGIAFSSKEQFGSSWDDWCGEYRRRINHSAGQQDSESQRTGGLGLLYSPELLPLLRFSP